MEFLVEGLRAVTWQQVVMYLVGFVLIYLAIKKEYEPSLLLPMGFGAILVNLPFSGVLDQTLQGGIQSKGIIEWLFQVGIDASEALPILLFIGIGRHDRFRAAADQSFDVSLWSGSPVRYLRGDPSGGGSGL